MSVRIRLAIRDALRGSWDNPCSVVVPRPRDCGADDDFAQPSGLLRRASNGSRQAPQHVTNPLHRSRLQGLVPMCHLVAGSLGMAATRRLDIA